MEKALFLFRNTKEKRIVLCLQLTSVASGVGMHSFLEQYRTANRVSYYTKSLVKKQV